MKRVMSKPKQVTWSVFFDIEGDDVFHAGAPRIRHYSKNKLGPGARIEMRNGKRYVILSDNRLCKRYEKREATRRRRYDSE